MVYDHVGVNVLKKSWINLDAVWAGAFVLAGVLTLFTSMRAMLLDAARPPVARSPRSRSRRRRPGS